MTEFVSKIDDGSEKDRRSPFTIENYNTAVKSLDAIRKKPRKTKDEIGYKDGMAGLVIIFCHKKTDLQKFFQHRDRMVLGLRLIILKRMMAKLSE